MPVLTEEDLAPYQLLWERCRCHRELRVMPVLCGRQEGGLRGWPCPRSWRCDRVSVRGQRAFAAVIQDVEMGDGPG